MVVTVLVILVGVTAFAIDGWRTRVARSEVQHNLLNVKTAMKDSRNYNGIYPGTVPSSFTPSSGVTVTVKSSSATDYCIEAVSNAEISIIYSIRANNGTPLVGGC